MGMARPKGERRYPTAFDQINQLTELRAELPWLADVPRNVCAQVLVELDKAWQKCFAKLARTPKWKRQGRDRMVFCQPHSRRWSLEGASLRFSKIGDMRVVAHRPLAGKPKTCTIKRDGDQWFAAITCELDVANPTARSGPVVAIDRGLINLGATSDGELIANPCHLEHAQRRLARAKRAVCRKKKGSRNREKANIRVMRIHRKVRRQRAHFLHVQSAQLAKSHGVVVLEKLNVAGMKRGRCASGISSAGWSKFAFMLSYKLAWSGGTLVEVPAYYSSQTCSACGCVDAKSRQSQAVFLCTSCGHEANADINAAKVLKQRYETPGNPWCLPVEGTGSNQPQGNRKRVGLRVPRRPSERSLP